MKNRFKIREDFDTEIGIAAIGDKKERMITGEVAVGNAETFIRSEVWAESLKTSIKKVNDMFGTSIRMEINEPDMPGGDSDVRE